MEREKEALKEWAKANYSGGFVQQKKESYWLKKGNQDYLQEWNFDAVTDVNNLLDQLEMKKSNSKKFEEVRKTVLVSTMKGKIKEQKKSDNQTFKDISLPEYIYVF